MQKKRARDAEDVDEEGHRGQRGRGSDCAGAAARPVRRPAACLAGTGHGAASHRGKDAVT